jgi:hypothetical protein
MMHEIANEALRVDWYLIFVKITFQAFEFKLIQSEDEFTIVKREKGFNIYELGVPIV